MLEQSLLSQIGAYHDSKIIDIKIMEKMDKYENENSIHINNQLNFRHIPVIPHLNSKPNLNLKESRSRLNIFSKATENLQSLKASSSNHKNNTQN